MKLIKPFFFAAENSKAQKALNILLNRTDISFEQKNRLELISKIYKNNAK